MGLFGRESPARQQRIERRTAWIHAHTRWGFASAALGVVAVLDSFTLVLGVLAGVAAIATGLRGRRELRAQPQLRGERWCTVGIVLGTLGLVLSLLMALVVYPRIGPA